MHRVPYRPDPDVEHARQGSPLQRRIFGHGRDDAGLVHPVPNFVSVLGRDITHRREETVAGRIRGAVRHSVIAA